MFNKKLAAITTRLSDATLLKIFFTLLVISSFLLGALWPQVSHLIKLKP